MTCCVRAGGEREETFAPHIHVYVLPRQPLNSQSPRFRLIDNPTTAESAAPISHRDEAMISQKGLAVKDPDGPR